MHEDASGSPKVAFVMNPTANKVSAKVALGGATALVDLLRADTRIAKVSGAFTVEVPPRTVRMFAVE